MNKMLSLPTSGQILMALCLKVCELIHYYFQIERSAFYPEDFFVLDSVEN